MGAPPVCLIQPFCPHCGGPCQWTVTQDPHKPLVDQTWFVSCTRCDWRGEGKRYFYPPSFTL